MKFAEWSFGSNDSRQLCMRWFIPWSFSRYDSDRGFVFAPLRLLNPANWWSAIRSQWEFSCLRKTGVTHRCYCGDGSLIDGRLFVAGFGVVWFYSHYTGEIPCWCDRVLAAMDDDKESPETNQ